MRHLIGFLILFFTACSFAQSEFHVFPMDGLSVKGSPDGNGSLESPWDLKTALSQSSERVNGGDIIWLHQGVYTGHFKSRLKSTKENEYIIVSAFKNDKVVLNGNDKSSKNTNESKSVDILNVAGNNVIFKNFEITYIGYFSRNANDDDFVRATGINHISGESKFQNLIIYNIPGLAFGSWRKTGGSVIEDCIMYNNGYIGKSRQSGEGMYVQNASENERIIRNNIIFSNYYKAIEVWSASSGKNEEFVKNITLEDNIIFNSGIPAGNHVGNLIIATHDYDAVNIAKNIEVNGNVLYHNVNLDSNVNNKNALSLTLGYIKEALVEDVHVLDNVIIGQRVGLNLAHIKSCNFKNNTIYSGFIDLQKSTLPALEGKNLFFDNNRYFTRKEDVVFNISRHGKYSLSDWQKTFGVDKSSQWKPLNDFYIEPVLKLKRLNSDSNSFNIALLEKDGKDVIVDFSNENIKKGTTYKIYDIENRTVVVKSGNMPKDMKITFPMGLKAFEKPSHNTIATKSVNNFGVYRIVFEKREKKKGFFGRLFGWLF